MTHASGDAPNSQRYWCSPTNSTSKANRCRCTTADHYNPKSFGTTQAASRLEQSQIEDATEQQCVVHLPADLGSHHLVASCRSFVWHTNQGALGTGPVQITTMGAVAVGTGARQRYTWLSSRRPPVLTGAGAVAALAAGTAAFLGAIAAVAVGVILA